ncbi:hypothetical protein VIGAN_09079500 [Vigna angularis var. angularis]|uniref:Secreted protein n=1 Tax=Vigna angularis var. angularis TaxID=157739 RepID=A0A0S3SX61_PHAAN|nr:hypothetical protein VIGAN_09079500 [Vigna angularis var. angularis]
MMLAGFWTMCWTLLHFLAKVGRDTTSLHASKLLDHFHQSFTYGFSSFGDFFFACFFQIACASNKKVKKSSSSTRLRPWSISSTGPATGCASILRLLFPLQTQLLDLDVKHLLCLACMLQVGKHYFILPSLRELPLHSSKLHLLIVGWKLVQAVNWMCIFSNLMFAKSCCKQRKP